jgi:alkylation response protein AidB-like acyl-CoA dehydrogenase
VSQAGVDLRSLDTPQEIVECARALVEPLRELSAAGDRERAYPYRQLELVRESGLEALLVPTDHGGMGATYMDEVRVVGILAEGDSNVAQIFHVHGTGVEICSQVAPPGLQARFHAATVAGRCRWSNAYSELGTKNIFEYSVQLTPDGDGYRLSGRKFYCTGSLGADVMYVTAVIAGTDELRLVLLQTDAPGVTIEDDWEGMGQVGTASGSTILDNVRVEAEQVVEMDGMATPESLFGPLGQLSFSAIHVGIAKAAWHDALEYVRTKTRAWVHSGVADAREDAILQVRVGEMRTWLDAAEAMQERAIDAMAASWASPSAESRALASVATSQAKAFTTDAGLRVCEMGFQVCGSSATLRSRGFDRHWRNLRTLSLHDPADYKHKMVGEFHLTDRLPPVTAYT